MALQDISSRKEIEIIVNAFYDKVKEDVLIGTMFSHVNWEKHLPLMYDFWDNVLFYTGNYTGNPMVKHMMAHGQNPMTSEHFDRWLTLFYTTVDERYSGNNASLLKERAKSIALIMQIKILGNGMNPPYL
jgi:hemoglobin